MRQLEIREVPDGINDFWFDDNGDFHIIADTSVPYSVIKEFRESIMSTVEESESEETDCTCNCSECDEYGDAFWEGFEAAIECLDLEPDMPVRAIFNRPATILFWPDGTKTVAKCTTGDVWDPEKGVMAAMLRKYLGYGYFERVDALIPDSARQIAVVMPEDKSVSLSISIADTRKHIADIGDSANSTLRRHREGLIEVADLLRKIADG